MADDQHSTRITRAIANLTSWLGSFPAILTAAALVILWLAGAAVVKGHLGNDTYQLVVNTATGIITFVMVFIIQNSQNREGKAVQAKLDAQNEVLLAMDVARSKA